MDLTLQSLFTGLELSCIVGHLGARIKTKKDSISDLLHQILIFRD